MFYLTREQLPFFLPLGFIGVYRWFWFLIRLLAFALYKPLQPRRHPRFKPQRDVTIVVPTIDSGDEIKLALRSWLANDPFEVIFVTIPKAKPAIDALVRDVDPNGNRIRVVTVPRGNKRNQMVKGINHCRTDILVFCDDDVIWPPTMLKWILAPFEDKQMGGVGTSQTVMPLGKTWTIWEILSAFRISMRNIEITATTYIDGGVCCLSGRTAAYRTSILRTQDFQQAFTHEYWRGKYHQHSGDDKFLTRWMHSNDWRTYIQSCPEAELKSTFKDNWRFLLQLLRWTRNTWRSDIRSLFLERKVWTRHPFVAFSMLDKMINPLTLLLGPVMLIYLCTKPQIIPLWVVLTSYFAWLILTRLLKYMPHFVKRPQDILALPVWIVFNIYFAIMKIYCLFTLHVTGWGTRVGAGEEGDAEEGDGGLYIPHWDEEVPGHPYPPVDDRERERERRGVSKSGGAGVARERSVSICVDGQRVGGGGIPESSTGAAVAAPAPASAGILIASRVPGPSPSVSGYAPVRGQERPGSVDLSVMTGYTDDEDDDAGSESTRWSGSQGVVGGRGSARWSGSQGVGRVQGQQ